MIKFKNICLIAALLLLVSYVYLFLTYGQAETMFLNASLVLFYSWMNLSCLDVVAKDSNNRINDLETKIIRLHYELIDINRKL